MLYVEYGEFLFENRRELEKGLLIIFNHFVNFGLETNIGRGPKPYKTECVFFLPPRFFKPSNHSSPALEIDSSKLEKKDK